MFWISLYSFTSVFLSFSTSLLWHVHHFSTYIYLHSHYMSIPFYPTFFHFLGYFSFCCPPNCCVPYSVQLCYSPPIDLNILISATFNFFSCISLLPMSQSCTIWHILLHWYTSPLTLKHFTIAVWNIFDFNPLNPRPVLHIKNNTWLNSSILFSFSTFLQTNSV